jgi:5-methyltetrahydrofolate--homocysteine methyltransferase
VEKKKTGKGKIVLATVKGDVHDIGKNIVGVVLGCNSLIGLSGLITPSLDEMVSVAREMERRHLTFPLLIGGATTSRQHTAVKIAPEYGRTTVHVLDASRVVDVVSSLLSDAQRTTFDLANREEQEKLRAQYGARRAAPLLPYSKALENRLVIDWRAEHLPAPSFTGRRVLDDVPLALLRPYIDWTFFFAAWELKGRFPAILDHPQYGPAARDLYEHAQTLLQKIENERLLRARGVYGFWLSAHDGDDIVLYADRTRARELVRFNMLRQQDAMPDGKPNLSLADFVADARSGVDDYVGAFAVTAGLGADDLATRYERAHDDYSAIIVKALADRLAEAFAAYAHATARQEWGIAAPTSADDILAERHRGIRPGFGYPAWHHVDRACRHVAGRECLRSLFRASRCPLLHSRARRQRSSAELRTSQTDDGCRGRAMAVRLARVRTLSGNSTGFVNRVGRTRGSTSFPRAAPFWGACRAMKQLTSGCENRRFS